MMAVSNSIFPANIIAFTSDRTVDFSLCPTNESLFNDVQRRFLSGRLDRDLPEPVTVEQVHGRRVVVVDPDFLRNRSVPEQADGAITRLPRVPLSVRTADCLPVFMYDPSCEGIGLVHVGWRGAQNNILKETVTLMKREWRTDPGTIKVFFGPAIHSCCYEVGQEFREYFPDGVLEHDGRYSLDLIRVCRKQLAGLGLRAGNILDSGICACCDKNYFSYRRERESAGRMLSLMMLKAGRAKE